MNVDVTFATEAQLRAPRFEAAPDQSSVKRMFRIALICEGLPPELGPQAAIDVAEEFDHRPWHRNLRCTWTGNVLVLVAENDFDSDGEALADEFSDAVSACIPATFGYRIRIDDARDTAMSPDA